MVDIQLIKKCIREIPDVIAAYLFGSSAGADQAVNDLDILVFFNEEANVGFL